MVSSEHKTVCSEGTTKRPLAGGESCEEKRKGSAYTHTSTVYFKGDISWLEQVLFRHPIEGKAVTDSLQHLLTVSDCGLGR